MDGKGFILYRPIFRSLLRYLVVANVPSSQALFTLMIVVILSSETSVLRNVKCRHISEDGTLLVGLKVLM
jgi:hypothetical protein